MNTIKLADGTEIVLDFTKIPYVEMRDWLNKKKHTDDDIYELLARVTGKPVGEAKGWHESLNYADYVLVRDRFFEATQFPNGRGSSVSAFTGE